MSINNKPHVIVHLGDFSWSALIDVTILSTVTQSRYHDRYTGKTYTDYPISRARKLLKLIYCYADADDLNKVTEALIINPKLFKYWRELIHEDDEID